jgi:hypothetical protein
MLEINFESEHVGGDRKRMGRFWRRTLWTFIFPVTLAALFPVTLEAQIVSSSTVALAQVVAYGTNVQTPLGFAGETLPSNQFSLSMGASAFYDDNVLATNAHRLGDEALSFHSRLGISRQTKRLKINFDYVPFFVLYRQIDQYDRLNHSADLDLTCRLTSRFSLGLHDSFSYQNGVYPSLTSQQIMSGPASPTSLNQMIFPYTTRTLSNMAGLDLKFVKSQRTSLTLSGGFNQLKFGNQTGAVQPLYNSLGVSGSLEYQYRLTEHTNFGLLLLHQDTTYEGGEVFGNRLRSQIESMFLSLGSRLSPTVTVILYGGPQYVHTVGGSSAESTVAGQFQPSGGGSITKKLRDTALDASFQRSISDSAGLYTSVINTYITLGVRRRLAGRWEANLRGGGARADASLFQLANGRTDAATGGIDFSRPLGGGSVLHISYDTIHQLSKGTLPIWSTFDRNQVTISFDYRLKAIPLGR